MRSRPGICLLMLTVIFVALAGACQSSPTETGDLLRSSGQAGDAADSNGGSTAQPGRDSTKPLAYVNGEPIRHEALFRPLIEAAGGEVLSELVLDRLVTQRLEDGGQQLTDADLDAERRRVLATLDPDDEDEAARLLRELRQQRSLGEQRFEGFLRRNAGLRKLVADQVNVTDEALRQAFERRYGEHYRARLLVVSDFDLASRLRQQVLEGTATFGDLAAQHSTDASADRGGLLSPISPVDPSYPQVLRDALVRLGEQAKEDGRHDQPVSEVLAMEGQFVLVKLEEKIAADSVEFADVREELAEAVRRQFEQRRMRQLARRMLSEANIVILDGALGNQWNRQREMLLNP